MRQKSTPILVNILQMILILDQEIEFSQQDQEENEQIRRKARRFRERAGVKKYHQKLAEVKNPPRPDLKARAKIQRKTETNRRQIQRDLKTINKAFDENRLDDKLLASLETKFLVSQHRGVHYLTSSWDKVARQKHREKDEKGKGQFSSSVLAKNDIRTYHELLFRLEEEGF